MSKIKDQTWFQLPRQSRLAACMWPDLMPPSLQAETARISHSTEGKKSPMEGKIARDKAWKDEQKTKLTNPTPLPNAPAYPWWETDRR